jgi:hypothetical protein
MFSDILTLTSKGFKLDSKEYIFFIIQTVLLVTLTLFFNQYNRFELWILLGAFLFCILFYIYYRAKLGSLYSLAYFYHLVFYIALLPEAFFNPIIFLFTILVFLVILLDKKVFREFKIPYSIFLLSFHLFIYFLVFKIFSIPMDLFDFKFSGSFQIDPDISGIFFPLSSLYDIEYSLRSYSSLEKAGLFSFLSFGLILLRGRFWKDICISILMISSIYLYFSIDIFYSTYKVFNLIGIWCLFYYSPGRNLFSLFSMEIISFLLLLLIQVLLKSISINYPFVFVLVVYFSIYGSMIYLITNFNFFKKLVLSLEQKI